MAFSVQAQPKSHIENFKSSALTITPSENQEIPEFTPETLVFGATHSNHMLQILFRDGSWEKPEIVPYKKMMLSPFNQTLQAAVTCFEGMKCYSGVDQKLRLFRPLENMARLKRSMDRLTFDVSWDSKEF
jgi:branched-chain amino acid aminotransferase